MGLCSWIILGFVAGLIARAVMPGDQPMGFIKTTLLGVVGSFVGGGAWALVTGGNPMHFRASGLIGSVIGALIVLFVAGLISRRSR